MDELLYRYRDYKQTLRARIEENRDVRGYRTRLARAAGCQKSFLSQALHSHVHLTPDHAAGIARLWKLDEDDTSHFLELVMLARAASPDLRAHLEARVRRREERKLEVAARFETSRKLPATDLAEYYSSWYYAAIHVLVSVPGHGTPERLASRLKLPPDLVRATLRSLQRMKLVEPGDAGWKVAQHDLFLPKGSPLVRAYHGAWRQKAIAQLQLDDPGALHFTSLYAMSRADLQRIKARLLEVIAEARRIMPESPEEDMACFTCDFFRVE